MNSSSRMATIVVAAIVALLLGETCVRAQQRTVYDREGNVAGRYTTDTQGTTTLYGPDGRVLGRASGNATIIMDGVGGTVIGDRPKREKRR